MAALILFGGTFDPVHAGHVAMARAALAAIPAASLTVLPAGNPWQRGRQPFAPGADRVRMLKLAFAGDAQVFIDARELGRAGPTYTVDTLAEYRREEGPATPLVWLIGADAFARLDTWHDWPRLLDLGSFAVVHRAGGEAWESAASEALRAALAGRLCDPADLAAAPAGRVARLAADVPGVSSTDIRQRIARGQSLAGLVPGTVCDHIAAHRLYLSQEQR